MTQSIYQQPSGQLSLPPEIFRHWIHSHEEDADGLEVFRPEGFAFPVAFGRDGFELRQNGRFIQEDIGLADGIVRTPGRWRSIGQQRVSVSFSGTARTGFTFEIVTLDKSILQIRRAVQHSGYGSGPAMDESKTQAYQALPPASSFRRLDFEHAEIITLESFPPQFVLMVSGTKPFVNMNVELVPVVHIQQPEYWEIEVVGALRRVGLPAETPYQASVPLAGAIGTKGIEVVGATRSQRFDLPLDQPQQGECRNWSAFIDVQPPAPGTLHVQGECEFPTGGFKVELRRLEPQGINPRNLLLEKIVEGPAGPATQVISVVAVRYEEPANAGFFDSVTILPDGPTLPVQEVQ